MKSYIIYKATSPSNKVYIGLTSKTLEIRKKEHIYSSKSNSKKRIFYSALQKYNYLFTWEIIESNLDKKTAENKEIYYIKLYNSTNKSYGYNQAKGGLAGDIRTEEGLAKWKAKMAKKLQDPEYLKKISVGFKKYRKRKDFKQKQREYVNNYFSKEENRKKHSEITKISNNRRDLKIKRAQQRGGKPFYCVETKKQYILLIDAARDLGSEDKQNIYRVLKNIRKSYKGFHFKYIGE